ncbi:uncharacterized protein KY384_004518 [Bacidia gigantensis]|uniref:uncharacterized protein n=1 Tax=Bacidia gigantensis TaxID=2732470 RepID=UPI001D04BCDB|nr:uncharacterized protein KY384_004518 [Bacidia gigantensis]KAG8531160.1 hypothetical protein KY384_004518 [Bacidia gigantensis]
MPRQSSRLQRTPTGGQSPSPETRPRRVASNTHAVVSRENLGFAGRPRGALRLIVKMPSSRLRQATSARDSPEKDTSVPTSRATRNKPRKSYVMESETDDVDAEGEEDEDAVMSDVSEEAPPSGARTRGSRATQSRDISAIDEEDEDEDEEEEEEEEEDAEGDIDMDDDDADDGVPLGAAAPALTTTTSLKIKGPAAPQQQPKVTVTPAQDTKFKSVEDKEMEVDDDDDDEELSELGSDEDEDEENDDEDAEGEEDVEDMEEGDESRSPAGDSSRASTPDISKMTKRQRSRYDQVMGSDFLQLPMEPQIKKHLTAEEHAMRRSEMARRRKNLSEKRNEEEKADTINRLLKKQAPKRRGKISKEEMLAQDREDDEEEVGEGERVMGGVGKGFARVVEENVAPANPVYVRWVSGKGGSRVGVPREWLEGPAGRVFVGAGAGAGEGGGLGGGRMVEEVEG